MKISTSNHMFKREIWDKFTEFTFLKFLNLPSKTREISKFQNMRGKFSQNFTDKHVIPGQSHVTSPQRAHKGKNYTKTININKFNKHNSITPTL